jgi:FPC/CPF motif-containing protein YcgG
MILTNSPTTLKAFLEYIESEMFACVAAKTAALMKTMIHRDCCADNKVTIKDAYGFLKEFVSQCEQISKANSSFVLSFSDKTFTDDAGFETFLWETLNQLHNLDFESGLDWSDECSSDPNSPQFGFSILGEPFFIVGLHSNASRISRCSPFPALVFNVHRQFNYLKRTGTFEKLQAEIRRRELLIQGSINPNINNVSIPGWKCPFSKKS